MEAKTVVLEVLAIDGWVEAEVFVGNESRIAQSLLSPPSSSHSISDFGICCEAEGNGVSTVVLMCQLVTELDDNMTLEWLFEAVIKLSLHQVGID